VPVLGADEAEAAAVVAGERPLDVEQIRRASDRGPFSFRPRRVEWVVGALGRVVDECDGGAGVGEDAGDAAEPRADLDVLVLVEPFEPERFTETVDDTEGAVAHVGDEHLDSRVVERLAGRVVVELLGDDIVGDTEHAESFDERRRVRVLEVNPPDMTARREFLRGREREHHAFPMPESACKPLTQRA
jgi:hypothetical protein